MGMSEKFQILYTTMKSKRIVTVAIIYLLLLVPVIYVLAQKYTVETVPNVRLRDASAYITDPNKLLDDDEYFELNSLLGALRDSLNIETAVVVLPSIEMDEYGSAREFANKLFNRWGLGDNELNNGLLILLITNEGEREIVFETGKGTEQVLTDGISKLIQTNEMVPWLKDGEYGKGLIAGVKEISKVIEGTSGLEEPAPKKRNYWPVIIYLVAGLIIIVAIDASRKSKVASSESPYKAAVNYDSLKGAGCVAAILFLPQFIIYFIYKEIAKETGKPAIDCEKCREKGTVKVTGEPVVKQQAIPGQDGMKEYKFVCSKCGFTHHELIPYAYVKPNTTSSSSSGTTVRSDSSSGGSWGGGSSGGGGASTRF